MRIFILLFYIVTMALEANQIGFLPEKLIISGSENIAIADEDLLKLKVYFIENPVTRKLQEKYDLHLEVEMLGSFHVVVIKPIKSLSLRNELLISLSLLFKDMFYIEYKIPLEVMKKSEFSKILITKSEIIDKRIEQNFSIDDIGLQWLSLWLLSLTGLILSVRNRKKMKTLSYTQKNLEEEQKRVEIEMKTLGATNG